jgi:hypothetical protein
MTPICQLFKTNQPKTKMDIKLTTKKIIATLGLMLLIPAGAQAQNAGEGYDIIVVAGQSNAVGRGLGDGVKEDDVYAKEAGRVFQLGRFGQDNGKIIPATEPLQHWGYAPGKDPDRKGFAYPFALRYAHSLEKPRKVLLVPAAQGSTSILQWDLETMDFTRARGVPDSPKLWNDMVKRIKIALESHPGNRVVAVLWAQSEADMTALANKKSELHPFMTGGDVYRAKLEALRAQLRTAFDVPGQKPFIFLVSEPNEQWKPFNGRPEGMKAKAEITQALKDAVASDPQKASGFVSTAGIGEKGSNSAKDVAHFSAYGAHELGIRYYKAFVDLSKTRK